MSTPDNKRDARREARLAAMQARQAERRIPKDEDVAPQATEEIEEPAMLAAVPPVESPAVVEETPIAAEMAATPFVPDPSPTVMQAADAPVAEVEVADAMTDAGVSETLDPAAEEPVTIAAAPPEEAPPVVEVAPLPAKAPATPRPTPPVARPTPAAIPAAKSSGTPISKTPTRPTTGAAKTTPPTATPKPAPIAARSADVVGASKTPTRSTATGAGATKAPSSPAVAKAPIAAAKTPTRPGANVGHSAASNAAPRGVAGRATPPTEAAEERYITKRDTRRAARIADLARVQTARRQRIQRAKRQAMLIRAAIIAGAIILALLIGLLIHNLTTPTAPAHPQPVGPHGYVYGSNISCGSEMVATHYHANLQIVIDGALQPVPAEVGIPNGQCLYWLHTHDTSGVIHIEAPADQANRTFYLGDLFAIWEKTPQNSIAAGAPELDAKYFFGKPIDKQHPLTAYVDGKVYTGDPNQIVLKAHENIWLEYGVKQVTPTSYDFTGL